MTKLATTTYDKARLTTYFLQALAYAEMAAEGEKLMAQIKALAILSDEELTQRFGVSPYAYSIGQLQYELDHYRQHGAFSNEPRERVYFVPDDAKRLFELSAQVIRDAINSMS